MSEAPILVRDLVKKYGDLTALDGISLEVAEGEIFCLLGPNGAGKTTLIRILSTALRPTSGTATIFGHDVVKEADKVRRLIGLVRQFAGTDYLLTVEDVLDFYAKVYRVPRSERKRRAIEVLNLVGLEDKRRSIVMTLSGGQLKRLALAKAFIHRPEVMLMDEPTTGLDPAGKREIHEYILQLRTEGTTIFMATHDTNEAEKLSDRVAIMDKGKIVACDDVHRLKKQIDSKEVMEVAGKGLTRALEQLRNLDIIKDVRVISGSRGDLPQIRVVAYAGGDLPPQFEHLKNDPHTVLVSIPLEIALKGRESIETYVRNIVEQRRKELYAQAEEEIVKLYVDSIDENLPRIVEMLLKNGVLVDKIQIKPVTLEDVFLAITGSTWR